MCSNHDKENVLLKKKLNKNKLLSMKAKKSILVIIDISSFSNYRGNTKQNIMIENREKELLKLNLKLALPKMCKNVR